MIPIIANQQYKNIIQVFRIFSFIHLYLYFLMFQEIGSLIINFIIAYFRFK